MKIRESLFYFLGQPYNWKFAFRRSESSSYCSELAAKAFAQIGFSISRKRPARTLPIDIQILKGKENWIDVSSVYFEFLRERLNPGSAILGSDFFLGVDALLEDSSLFAAGAEERMQNAVRNQARNRDLVNEVHKLLGKQPLQAPQEQKSYWDTQIRRRRPKR